MVAVIVIVLLVGFALAYVATPLRRPGAAATATPEEQGDAIEASAKKDAALSAIVDIETERRIGKLSAADFEELRREYEAAALEALKELDTIRLSERTDDALEAEIAAVRARLECPACGAPRSPGEQCPRCGS